jgi:hypothetical protein
MAVKKTPPNAAAKHAALKPSRKPERNLQARAALADSLLESIDTEIDEDAESKWREEIRKRMAELNSGPLRAASWSEVENRVWQRLDE